MAVDTDWPSYQLVKDWGAEALAPHLARRPENGRSTYWLLVEPGDFWKRITKEEAAVHFMDYIRPENHRGKK